MQCGMRKFVKEKVITTLNNNSVEMSKKLLRDFEKIHLKFRVTKKI